MTAHPMPSAMTLLHPMLQSSSPKGIRQDSATLSGSPPVIPESASPLSISDSLSNVCLLPFADQLSDLPSDLQNILWNLPFFPRDRDASEIAGIDEFLKDISQVMHIRHFSPGDVMIQEGEKARAMFFVIKGIVKVISEDGEINFAELRPGSYFGEIGVLFNINRTATVTAKTKCTLAVLTSDDLDHKLVRYPQINTILRTQANERYEQLKREMEKAGRRRRSELCDKSHEMRKESSHGSLRELSASRVASRRTSEETKLYNQLPAEAIPTPGRTSSDDFTTSALAISVDAGSPPPSSGVPLSPTSDSAGLSSPAANFAARHGGRRRASVAVWSDDRLMQFAQSASEKYEQGKEKHTVAVPSNLHRAASELALRKTFTTPPVTEIREFGVFGRDLMARILSHLDFRQRMRVRLCSMHILRLLLDPRMMLTTVVDLSPWHKRIDDKVISDIVCFCGQTVRSLSLRNCWGVTDKGLAAIAHYAADGLETLCLASVWDITDGGIASMARMCSHLKDLDLSNCRKLSDAGISSMLDACSNIDTLTLSYCKNLTDAILGHSRWKTVRRVNMQRCTGIFDAGFSRWASQAAEPDPEQVSTQTVPEADEFTATLGAGPVTQIAEEIEEESYAEDDFMDIDKGDPFYIAGPPRTLSSSFHQVTASSFALQELILSDCSFLTDATVAAIAASCHNLQILSLSFCCAVTEDFAEHLSAGCPHLRALDMSFCGTAVTDTSLGVLARGLRCLERLSIRGCVQVTEKGITYLARYARRLRMLNVSQCKNVNEQLVEKTGRGWRLLTCQGLVEVDEVNFRLNGGKVIGKGIGRKERARASTA
ncbi:uncharacterized protein SPPG_05384 [Spizellomyces punctatus DAOM BR117]|uniref:Cyclic nucleotide-binding domain-containing protein n=1 Tax=Spizellomyces punctatus (strain DAOM BR117) TaxID=645134 RepID=A0A0L0HC68_SPIPD|nr:uncharacterized protein SPPG_05384 [Spizellomyces punctatus DAOM BR117]KNC99125.1 hypothetical protein SPPG_05384 [Spizellomyces punctatus DAOM BR117]|eukprot:XP_016607165.1 hypothetical protein SPPG_05384 [Spizellomyces punctatus DAOM BR117]